MEVLIDGEAPRRCSSVILVPEKAIVEPGYIQTFVEEADAAAKHGLHALSQMAYFQFQDDELSLQHSKSSVRVSRGNQNDELNCGLCICRGVNGNIFVLSCGDVSVKKLLEAAYRFCTRWVRLDI